MTSSRILRYAFIGLIVVMLSALAGWYFFLRGEKESIAIGDAGRGAGLPEPFGSAIGSTYENIVSSFSTLVGGVVRSGEERSPQLARVGNTPTAGYGFVGSGEESRLRFVERGTGYVFDVVPETGALERRTNTLIPRTYEALVAGTKVILRGTDDNGTVTTIAGEITTSTSTKNEPAALKQRRLPEDIRSIAIAPSGTEIFYVIEVPGSASGMRASWDGTSEKKILTSSISRWQTEMLADNRIVLTENAADGVEGHAYLLRENVLAPIVGSVSGLTFLPNPKTSAYLYGESSGGAGGGLFLYARSSTSSSVALLPLKTVAQKCAWSPRESNVVYCAVPQQSTPPNFLDLWYRGDTHIADSWWKVDISANAAEPVYDSANASFDVEDPVMDDAGEYIAFRNAMDKSLWLLRIEE